MQPPRSLIESRKKDDTLKRCFDEINKITRKRRSRTMFQFVMKINVLYRTAQYSLGRKTN